MNDRQQHGMGGGMGQGEDEDEDEDGDEGGQRKLPPTEGVLFDHERLHVYRRARELFLLTLSFPRAKMPLELRKQLERALVSILSNIGEGAGKTARADKRRFYEIAKGSTTEAATQLDMLHMLGVITDGQLREARNLLVQVARMLHALCAPPRDCGDDSSPLR